MSHIILSMYLYIIQHSLLIPMRRKEKERERKKKKKEAHPSNNIPVPAIQTRQYRIDTAKFVSKDCHFFPFPLSPPLDPTFLIEQWADNTQWIYIYIHIPKNKKRGKRDGEGSYSDQKKKYINKLNNG